MPISPFTDDDRLDMASRDITEETVTAQLAMLRKGTPWIWLRRPCTIGDGIAVLSADEVEALSLRYDEAVASGRVMKFVPASGAASRMFQALALDEDSGPDRFLTTCGTSLFSMISPSQRARREGISSPGSPGAMSPKCWNCF